ncbi:MAG: helix-turn-helix transcriptional regulator [Micrococcales bacterium]|nr:helix-turn-helix transcriptional regulator [Micrococcales bacterium]
MEQSSAGPAADLATIRRSLPDQEEIVDVADVFSLLGDPARLRILVALTSRPLRVRDLAVVSGSSESAVSHALRLLRAHRVVSAQRIGREAHYRLADSHVRALLELALDHVGHTGLLHGVGVAHDDAPALGCR